MNTEELVRNDPPAQADYRPAHVDVFEDDLALCIAADLPGVAPGHAEVSLDDGYLTVIGRVESGTNGAAHVTHAYRRRFALSDPTRFDTEHISAVLRLGVLEVRLPKVEKAKPRHIAVTVN
jgi:HSP20 family protein